MTVSRRDVLVAGLASAGVAAAGGLTSLAFAQKAAAAASNVSPAGYITHLAPLQPAAFLRLPPGSVQASGWLATQLNYQVNGLNGQYPQVSGFLDYSATGWINKTGQGWEEVPYWLRGLVPLAHVTGDTAVQDTADQWISGVMATATASGFFGPTELLTDLGGGLDPWPLMPMMHALRSTYEYSGDGAILTLMTNYYAFLATQSTSIYNNGWGATRWGDTLDVLFWLYDRTGNSALLNLATTIHNNSANWVSSTLPTLHNVNVAQGFREPAQYSVYSGSEAQLTASYNNYASIMGTYGQFPGGGFAGDEIARPGYTDARQGFETCGIVEFMGSHEILHRQTGDPRWADRVEELAFNSLPAALDPQGKVCHYITSANSIDLNDTIKTLGQFDDTGFGMQAYLPGVTQYRCCPHNYGQGWPYLTEEMWLATPDGGLCAAIYGPSTVTAQVTGGVSVTITEATTYPFSDTVTLTLAISTPTAFPLLARIPGWCSAPSVTVNGAAVTASAGPSYARISRTWSNRDVVTLTFPMAPVTKIWSAQENAASVSYGPLEFSLKITENWSMVSGTAQWPQWQVDPGSAWNYGLVPGAAISVATGGNVNDPFNQANAPITLTTSGQVIADWQADSQQVVTPLVTGPVAASGPVEQVSLIPMGAARLRITSFPQTGGTATWPSTSLGAFKIRNRNSGLVIGVSGESTADSVAVVQAYDNGTADHRWQLVDAGSGNLKIKNVNSGLLLAVSGESTIQSALIVQFHDNGTPDHLWRLLDNGSGWLRISNFNSGMVLGVPGESTGDSVQLVQYPDTGTPDHDWQLIPDGQVKVFNRNSDLLLGVSGMSTTNSADVVQFGDTGTADHLWQFLPNADGSSRIQNVNSGLVLGVAGESTANSAQVVQFADTGTPDHNWILRAAAGAGSVLRIQNVNSGLVLAVANMSTADSANVVQFADNGTADHDWQLVAAGSSPDWPGTQAAFKLLNRNSGLVLGVAGESMTDSADVVQYGDTGSPDHRWWLVDDGAGHVKIQNANSGLVLGVSGESTADSADVVQFADTGTPDHRWQFLDDGSGWLRIQNVNSGLVLGVSGMSTADSAQVVQFGDTGTADHYWQLIPNDPVKLFNLNSAMVMGVAGESTAAPADVVQFADTGTPDHLWVFLPNADGSSRIKNLNSGLVLGIAGESTADSAQVVQFTDNGTLDHNWIWRSAPGAGTVLRLQNVNSGLVLGIAGMSTTDSAAVVQFADNGTPDHNWRVIG
jgi:Beta-L-arabinofuranosidase, GH127/Ricin-type beta-trefoil lectin domain-like